MDLWVRSQDKTRLVKVCSLEYGGYNEIHYINGYCLNEVDNYDLGTYKTKERALEVLDEIQNYLEKMGTNEMLTNEVGIINGIKHYGIVYEMPKE